MKVKTLLQQETDKCYEKLFKFAKTRTFDSGVRWVEMEFYIKGLEKAGRLVNKQSRLEKIDKTTIKL